MCWKTDGENCSECQAIFDACDAGECYANLRRKISIYQTQCVLCNRKYNLVEPGVQLAHEQRGR